MQPGIAVFDDDALDSLTGGVNLAGGPSNLDWYIYNLLQDVLNNHQPGETETDTNGFPLP